MRRDFHPMMEMRLLYREQGREDVPIYVAIGEAYSPPDVLDGIDDEAAKAWSAVRVKLHEESDEGTEILGATQLEAIEHAILHVTAYFRNHLMTGELYDLDGKKFDPDEKSAVFRARQELELASRSLRR